MVTQGVSPDAERAFIGAAFRREGLPATDAAEIAGLMTEADRRDPTAGGGREREADGRGDDSTITRKRRILPGIRPSSRGDATSFVAKNF